MRLMTRIAVGVLLLAVIFVAAIQVRHDLRFGHFIGLGLHADYTVERADLAIPGITKVYNATLTNFGALPRKVCACEFVTDAMGHGTALAYAIEKWDGTAQAWSTAWQPTKASFCKPYPLGIIEGRVVEKRLWPSQNLSIGEEATGARVQKGDLVRFVLFAAEPWTGTSGYPTVGFEIDEQVATAVPMRVRH